MEDSGLSAALGRTHQLMINSLQVDQDKSVADRLENFYNRIIYNRTMTAATDKIGLLLDQYLTDKLATRIQISMGLHGIAQPKFTWQSFETTIGTISQKMINNIFQTRSQLQSAQAGTGQTYVPILTNIPEELKEEFLRQLSIVEDGPNTRTHARMGKNDVLITATLKPDMEEGLRVLETLSLSIKNYSGTIKLEAVNPLKGYLAIMQHFQQYVKDIDLVSAYMKYYGAKTVPADDEVTLHLNHLLNVYALTGLGTFDLMTGKSVAATRFLVVNTGRNVRVYSTAEMIQDMFEGQGQTFLFGSKKTRRSGKHLMRTVKKYS